MLKQSKSQKEAEKLGKAAGDKLALKLGLK
jgi:hypothetical protein